MYIQIPYGRVEIDLLVFYKNFFGISKYIFWVNIMIWNLSRINVKKKSWKTKDRVDNVLFKIKIDWFSNSCWEK